ncbi:hypothetical protein ACFWBI_12670 [Streptomyces sp. NPDC059982]|uniref:hypothetical protein n=1 Tax=Streptomyces sp. NPDC059982 TaxID=3347024 RepID=UPI0036B169EE
MPTAPDGVPAVSSTGPPMDRAEVPRLLEPFRRRAERRHTAGEGAGLDLGPGPGPGPGPGLSIVASIARAHEAARPSGRNDTAGAPVP